MTTEQKYYRRLARKYGKMVPQRIEECASHVKDGFTTFGLHRVYDAAQAAAWYAFQAHPELREK